MTHFHNSKLQVFLLWFCLGKPLICVRSLLFHHFTLSLHPQTTLRSLLNAYDEWVWIDGRLQPAANWHRCITSSPAFVFLLLLLLFFSQHSNPLRFRLVALKELNVPAWSIVTTYTPQEIPPGLFSRVLFFRGIDRAIRCWVMEEHEVFSFLALYIHIALM